MSQIYHKYITHKLYILQISQVTNMTNMQNILLGKKIRNIFDLKNIFFLQILSSFSFSLRKKMYFPCPIISPLFHFNFSSPLQKKTYIHFLNIFLLFPLFPFVSDIKPNIPISPVILSHITDQPADLSSPIWSSFFKIPFLFPVIFLLGIGIPRFPD